MFSLAPFFSIIIPTYNSENTILISLGSILNQTFNNFEILIIDNISTDKTITIAEEFIDKRIKIYSEKDFGIYDAMNKGIKFSIGNWLYFLGSDDVLYNNKVLENISDVINQNPSVDVIYGNVYSSRFNGTYDGEFSFEKLYEKNICHQSIFISKTIFQKIGNFNTNFRYLADYEHNINWFLNKKIKNIFVNIIIANYADGGLSSRNVDIEFFKKLDSIYFNYHSVLPFNLKIQILKNIHKNSQKKLIDFIFYFNYYSRFYLHKFILTFSSIVVKNLKYYLNRFNS